MPKAIRQIVMIAMAALFLGAMTACAESLVNTHQDRQTDQQSIWPNGRDWTNLIFGFFIGLLANFVTGTYSRKRERKRLAEKFGWAAGDYVGRVQKTDSDELDEAKKKSRATVTYLRDNMLKIEVTDPEDQPWIGEIAMEGEQSGTVAWRYRFPQTSGVGVRHRFGIKRCIFMREDLQGQATTLMYLIGDKSEGYGNEVFCRS